MFQKLLLKDRKEIAPPGVPSHELLTRYAPDQERPERAENLTRFNRRHIREGASARIREDAASAPAPTQEPVQGPDLDLYSEQPISIGVLMRALPERFAEAQSEISDAFDLHAETRKTA